VPRHHELKRSILRTTLTAVRKPVAHLALRCIPLLAFVNMHQTPTSCLLQQGKENEGGGPVTHLSLDVGGGGGRGGVPDMGGPYHQVEAFCNDLPS